MAKGKSTRSASSARSNSSAPSRSRSSEPSAGLSLFVLAMAIGLAFLPSDVPSLTGPPAASKPWSSFDEFYQHYQTEHTHPTCRLLHVIGTCLVVTSALIVSPEFLIALFFSINVGFVLANVCRGLETGAVEGAALLATGIITHGIISGGRYKLGFLFTFLGYLCAWCGHFVFEQNKPATFIAPSYSLASDFRMCLNILSGVESL